MAQVGGITVADINKLELEFCKCINWNTILTMDDWQLATDALSQSDHLFWDMWQHDKQIQPTAEMADPAQNPVEPPSLTSLSVCDTQKSVENAADNVAIEGCGSAAQAVQKSRIHFISRTPMQP